MKNQQSYAARRAGRSSSSAAWARNANTVRHSDRRLGPVSSAVIVMLLVLTMGLIYVSQGAKASGYDYELSAVESEIAELNAKKDDLAVEQARATSVTNAKSSEVAANMVDAEVTGYAD